VFTDIGAAALRRLDPETAHGLAIAALRTLPLPPAAGDDPILATTIAGMTLANPVGLAAGLDKNAEALHGLSRLGFGFVECGSVTPLAQAGNPKPRLFRLAEDRAIINRMGFNNAGLEAFAKLISVNLVGMFDMVTHAAAAMSGLCDAMIAFISRYIN
jgi:dihydroorotate dehydrogenase